jgi:hypothetical protein
MSTDFYGIAKIQEILVNPVNTLNYYLHIPDLPNTLEELVIYLLHIHYNSIPLILLGDRDCLEVKHYNKSSIPMLVGEDLVMKYHH